MASHKSFGTGSSEKAAVEPSATRSTESFAANITRPDSHETSTGASIREPRYMVNPAERVRELLFRDEIPDTAELTYSFNQGYEKLDYRESEQTGSLHFAGSYHPDGMCDGEHICSFCGSVHT